MNLLAPITSYLNARTNLTAESQVLLRRVHTALALILESNMALFSETPQIEELPDSRLFCINPRIVELSGNYAKAVADTFVEEVGVKTYGIGDIGMQRKPADHKMIIGERDGFVFLQNSTGIHLKIDGVPQAVLGITDDILETEQFRIPRYRYFSHTFLL